MLFETVVAHVVGVPEMDDGESDMVVHEVVESDDGLEKAEMFPEDNETGVDWMGSNNPTGAELMTLPLFNDCTSDFKVGSCAGKLTPFVARNFWYDCFK